MNVGIVGLGKMGMIHYRSLQRLKKTYNIDTIYCYDERKIDNVELLTDSFTELVERSDAVIIATPTDTHFSLAKYSLEMKKPTFVEKPVAMNSFDLMKLKPGDLLFGGFIERYNSVIFDLKELLIQKKGIFENILFIEFNRVSNLLSDLWRPGGVIRDLGSHDFDLIYFLFNLSPYVSSSHIIRKDDVDIYASIDLKWNSILFRVNLSWIDLYKQRNIRIFTESHLIVVDLIDHQVSIFNRESSIKTDLFSCRNNAAEDEMRAFLDFSISHQSHGDIIGLYSQFCIDDAFLREIK